MAKGGEGFHVRVHPRAHERPYRPIGLPWPLRLTAMPESIAINDLKKSP